MGDYLKQRERERKLEKIRGKAKGGAAPDPRAAKLAAMTKGALSLWLPAQADEALRKAYLDLHTLKHELDQMEEVPRYLRGYYGEIMDALEALGPAQQAMGQLREGAKRVDREIRRG